MDDKTKLTDKEIEDHVNEVAVWEPIDINDSDPKMGYVDEMPLGPERDMAEKLLAEKRKRREAETS